MDFGIMFFSSAEQESGVDQYGLLLQAARYADEHGFGSVWTPERHFHEFGALFPNPAITSAALATITTKIQIRAGSLISPLHDTIRIVEDWSVVDNLSGGRIAVSFGSGWNADDFVLRPEVYTLRRSTMIDQIGEIKELWSGKAIKRLNGSGRLVELKTYPRPVQKELPIWMTSSGSVDTFVQAADLDVNILTHLVRQDITTVSDKISRYRATLLRNGVDPARRTVTLMVHTYLGDDGATARRAARPSLREYLRSAIALERRAAEGGGEMSGRTKMLPDQLPEGDLLEELLDVAVDSYLRESALVGTVEDGRRVVSKLASIGVTEIACLIDFGLDREAVLRGLEYLSELRAHCVADSEQPDPSVGKRTT